MSTDLNRINKRAIEALALAPLIEAAAERIGRAEALAMLRRVNEKVAFERGREAARTGRANDIPALIREVSTWGDGGRREMNILEQTENSIF